MITRIISMNVKPRGVSWFGHDKHLPLPYCLAVWPLLKRIARRATINHVFASASERILTPRLAGMGNTLLTICKDSPALDRLESNLESLRRLRKIVVESERHRELLIQGGVAEDRIHLIYPGVMRQPFVPAPDPFTIMFATSPKSRNDFLSRGVYLMIRVASQLPQVQFRLIWRTWNHDKLQALIREAGVGNVEVINGYVRNMESMYETAHAVILPALTDSSLKPCPHSGLHALAHGKPLLVSRHASLAAIVERHRCGVVFEPTVQSLREAVRRLQSNYDHFQSHAHDTLEKCFSHETFLERYRDLYSQVADEAVPAGESAGDR